MRTMTIHRIRLVLGTAAVVAFAFVTVGTATGREALAWVYVESTEALTNAIHIHGFPLDRLDPTCPQCM
jgi:hypothetical protein